MSTVIVETCKGPIEYLESGEGPAVLCLHGAMGGYDQSDLLRRTVFEDGFRFLALTRPGYLGTPMSVGKTPEEQADAYAAFLDALGIDKAVVAAISGGGPSALHFALRFPERCRGLILISTCGAKSTTPLPTAFYILKFLGRWPTLFKLMRGGGKVDLRKNLSRSISDPEVLERVISDDEVRPLLEELTASGMDRMPLRLPGTLNDVEVTRTRDYPLEQVSVPTLVIHGTKDPFVPFEEHGKVLATRIPGARLLAAEGGEHVTIFTHRTIVRERVAQFMASLQD